MTKHLRVLTVFSDYQLAERLQALLSRRLIEVNRVPSGAGALILTGNLSYDLIVIEHPLSDIATEDFLASIRTLDSTSTGSPVLVFASDSEIARLAGELDDDLVQVAAKDANDAEIQTAVSVVLGVAARYAARVMVQIEVGLESGISTRMYQAENLSESGMLLRGGLQIPVGTPVRFEFSLPNETDPIAGIGQVVRHTTPAEATRGIAVQFAELADDNVRRLTRFTANALSSAPLAPSEPDETVKEAGQQG